MAVLLVAVLHLLQCYRGCACGYPLTPHCLLVARGNCIVRRSVSGTLYHAGSYSPMAHSRNRGVLAALLAPLRRRAEVIAAGGTARSNNAAMAFIHANNRDRGHDQRQ